MHSLSDSPFRRHCAQRRHGDHADAERDADVRGDRPVANVNREVGEHNREVPSFIEHPPACDLYEVDVRAWWSRQRLDMGHDLPVCFWKSCAQENRQVLLELCSQVRGEARGGEHTDDDGLRARR